MVRACYTPQQPLQNHPSGHVGGWATPWSAEEMLDGQHQRVDIPAHARTAHKGLLKKRLEEDLCRIVPHVPRRSNRSRNQTELNCGNGTGGDYTHSFHCMILPFCPTARKALQHRRVPYYRFPSSAVFGSPSRNRVLLRTQSSKVLPLKPGVDQNIATHASPTVRDFFLANFNRSGPFTCIFSKTSPEFSLCWLWLMPVLVWTRRIK